MMTATLLIGWALAAANPENASENTTTANATDYVLMYSQWWDNGTVDSYKLHIDWGNGTASNFTEKTFNGNGNWTNYTMKINSTELDMTITFKFYANDTEGYQNVTTTDSFTTQNFPPYFTLTSPSNGTTIYDTTISTV